MELIEEAVTDFWIIAKFAILIFLGVYIVFSAVLVKQAKLMTETLNVELDSIIVAVSYIHLIVAIGVFFSSLVLL